MRKRGLVCSGTHGRPGDGFQLTRIPFSSHGGNGVQVWLAGQFTHRFRTRVTHVFNTRVRFGHVFIRPLRNGGRSPRPRPEGPESPSWCSLAATGGPRVNGRGCVRFVEKCRTNGVLDSILTFRSTTWEALALEWGPWVHPSPGQAHPGSWLLRE